MQADEERGARPEQAHPRPLGQRPQDVQVGVAGTAVVERSGRRRRAGADQEVPHHPAGRREPEEPIAGATSRCSPTAFECSSTTPPCPWTIGFGSPVVPDEYRIQSGWSNGTGSNVSGSGGPASRSAQAMAAVGRRGVRVRYGIEHVRSSAGSAARSSSMTSRRSNGLPP